MQEQIKILEAINFLEGILGEIDDIIIGTERVLRKAFGEKSEIYRNAMSSWVKTLRDIVRFSIPGTIKNIEDFHEYD